MDEMDEIVKEFLVESSENLDQLEQDFVTLERSESSDPEVLGNIFRTIHTIQGTCGFLGFSKMEEITYLGEDLLGRLKTGEIVIDEDLSSALLNMVEAVREIIGNVESVADEGETDYSGLIDELTRLQQAAASAA